MTNPKQTDVSNHVLPLALSAAELARALGISVRHVRRLDREGKLPRPVRLGRSVRWLAHGPTGILSWLSVGCPDRQTFARTGAHSGGMLVETHTEAPLVAPPRLTPEEIAVRNKAKKQIAAKYGFADWNSAPDEALREYGNFLKVRMEAQQ